jgi:hypothetical protein
MTALSIQPTFPVFTERDGQPLRNGYIWLGVANLPPQTNPINVYWDAALTVPAAQPIRTINGYPSNNGTPGRLYVNSDYSILVQDRKSTLVYSSPTATERLSDVVITGLDASDVAYLPGGPNAQLTTVQTALRRTISVDDFGAVGDGIVNDSLAFQRAVDYAESLVGSSAFDTVGVEIVLGPKRYKLNTTITVERGGIGFRGALGRGSMVQGNVLLFDVGDPTNAQRIRFVSFENIHFFCDVANGSTAGVRLYRTIQTQFERCNFSNWNIAVDSVRGSTTHFDRCYWANSLRNVQGQAFIKLSGLDESLFPSPPVTGAPGGGIHLTDCEFDGGGATMDMLYGIQVRSVDGLYVTQCHWTNCVHTIGIVPEGIPDSHVILDVHVSNCYFDGPSQVTADPTNVLIGGTVRETVTMASGVVRTSVYEKIKFVGCTFRGDTYARHGVSISVTDGDSWWDNGNRRLEDIIFSACMFGQARRSGLFISGAATTPTNTFVEPYGVIVDGCVFYDNASISPSGVGTAINAQAESIIVSNNAFLPDNGTSDFVVNLVPSDAGDDAGPASIVVTGNDFSKSDGATVRPLNISAAETGVSVEQSSNLFPGSGTRIDEVYRRTTPSAATFNLWSYSVPQGAAGYVKARVVGSTATGTYRVVYEFTVGFGRNAAGTNLSTGTTNWTTVLSWNPDSIATPPAAILNSNALEVNVTGVAATDIDWDVHIDLVRSR